MPIIGRTPAECVDTFRRHVARLVSKTITTRFPVRVIERAPRMIMSLSDGAAPLPLDTNVGRVFFSLGQALEAVREDDGAFRLRTIEYLVAAERSARPRGAGLLVDEAPHVGDLARRLPLAPRRGERPVAETFTGYGPSGATMATGRGAAAASSRPTLGA
jgi:hypothetical protein